MDELFSIRDAKELRLNVNIRPLYYILLRVWMQFGTSDAWLRGLSVLFGLGSVFLTYQLGRRLAGEKTGLLAALLLALSPLFINHAQEVR
ncbi:glycosyltransferase family 39 protein, partial [Staphylococcus pseudintermedius]|uniref:glycosyltransferase family 39 protein n=1 Tax=Staphylococcus pseudintermedius TaxID=283734 RepID=UPI000D879076